ncbi:hypothetical protein OSTOST_06136 [Ostertagia ostertagi]
MINHYESRVSGRSYDVEFQKTKEAINHWLSDYPSLQRLMYPFVPYVGCAYKYFNTRQGLFIKIACAYPNKRPWLGPLIPEPTGYSCRNDWDCKRYGWHYNCVISVGLCFAPFDTEYWFA